MLGERGLGVHGPRPAPAPPAAHQQVCLRVTPRRNRPACGAWIHSHRRRRTGQNGRLVHSGGFWKACSRGTEPAPRRRGYLRLCCAVWLPGPPHPLPDSLASRPGRRRTCGTPVPALGTPWENRALCWGKTVPGPPRRRAQCFTLGGRRWTDWRPSPARGHGHWGEAGRHSLHQVPPGSLVSPASGILEGHSEPALAWGGGGGQRTLVTSRVGLWRSKCL